MAVSGVIVVNKEAGMTSFGVVSRLRRIFDQKKIGHTGTLDPDAEGVLPVCLGKATRLVERLSRGTKSYEAEMKLGVVTDTQDLSGTVLRTSEVCCSEEEVREAVLKFTGPQIQIPPMYSAVKVNGKKLYELARKGIEVERKGRQVEFHQIEILEMELPYVKIAVTCSHGSYIRTLCHDIGERLGCGAAMGHLLRTQVDDFSLSDALTLEEIQRRKEEEDSSEQAGKPYSFVIPPDRFYMDLPAYSVRKDFLRKCVNGIPVPFSQMNPLPGPHSDEEKMIRLYDPCGNWIGLFRKDDKKYRLEQYFYEDHAFN